MILGRAEQGAGRAGRAAPWAGQAGEGGRAVRRCDALFCTEWMVAAPRLRFRWQLARIGPHNVAVRLVFTQSHKFSLLFFIISIPHNLKRREEKRSGTNRPDPASLLGFILS